MAGMAADGQGLPTSRKSHTLVPGAAQDQRRRPRGTESLPYVVAKKPGLLRPVDHGAKLSQSDVKAVSTVFAPPRKALIFGVVPSPPRSGFPRGGASMVGETHESRGCTKALSPRNSWRNAFPRRLCRSSARWQPSPVLLPFWTMLL